MILSDPSTNQEAFLKHSEYAYKESHAWYTICRMNTSIFVQLFLVMMSAVSSSVTYSPCEDAGTFYFQLSKSFYTVTTPQSASIPTQCPKTYRSHEYTDRQRRKYTLYACPPGTPGVFLSTPTLATYGSTFCRAGPAPTSVSAPAVGMTLTGPAFKVGSITYYPTYSCLTY